MPSPVEAVLGRAWLDALGWGLLHSLWQETAIALVAVGALVALRKSHPTARYAAAYASLCAMLASPVATVWMRRASFDDTARVPPGLASVADVVASASVIAWFPWLVSAWSLGVLALSIRVLGGWTLVRRLRAAGGQPLPEEWQDAVTRLRTRLRVSRLVTVVESTLADVPGVVGWLRPVIFLPVGALTGLGSQHLEAILAHELAHVRRHDYVMNLGQTAIETLLFYHPAVWWISRRVRVERENCCDDLAVSVCGDPVEYASALTHLERLRTVRWQPAMSAAGGHLISRIRRLTADSSPHDGISVWAAGALSCLTLAVVVAIAQSGLAGLAFLPGPWSGSAFATPLPAPLSLPPATLLTGTLLGALLGIRHVFEPDHLAAISTLVSSERGPVRSAWLGASWGVGHTCALVAVGAVLAVVQANVPLRVTEAFEIGVAIMSMALGLRAVRAGLRLGAQGPDVEHAHGALTHRHRGALDHIHIGRLALARRPLLVGVVHGLAGSGALTALVMASLPSASARVAFIVLFGLGSTISMAVLSGCAGWPLARLQQAPRALAILSGATGCAAIAFGLASGWPLVRHWIP